MIDEEDTEEEEEEVEKEGESKEKEGESKEGAESEVAKEGAEKEKEGEEEVGGAEAETKEGEDQKAQVCIFLIQWNRFLIYYYSRSFKCVLRGGNVNYCFYQELIFSRIT